LKIEQYLLKIESADKNKERRNYNEPFTEDEEMKLSGI
jgi:hypothetical protein